MHVIGLTGGVGSGKSTVAQLMEKEWNAKILIADEIGHLAFLPQSDTYKEIVSYFGRGILDEKGEVSHAALAEEIFAADEKREALNAIIHPFVISYIKEQLGKYRDTDNVIVIESAILIESGCVPLCGEVWYVYVPEEIRRQRLKISRNYTDEKIDSIMDKQMPEEAFLKAASVVIDNSRELEEVRRQICMNSKDISLT